ncbi:fungal hydrophobin, partial [Agrocybe pediades]
MFSSRIALLVAASLASFAVAAPHEMGDIVNSCNTDAVQCCNQIFESGSEQSNFLHGILGTTISAITAQAGLACVPITGIGIGSGAQCSSQPVCCSDNHMNGLIVIGCNPININ